ncbi:MAG: FG-GAP-like repeat-containing protein [Pirellulaceae bacterium]
MVDTAVATFDQIVQKDPGHLASLFCLGMLRAYLGNDEQALECFEKVYRQDGDNSFVAYSYAKALRNRDRVAEAVPILEKIVERDPGFVSAVYLLGTLYMRNKKMAEAKSLMARFRELNQDELAVGTFVVDDKYGMAGKYYFALGADGLPLPPQRVGPVQRVVFSPEPQAIGEISQAWDVAGGSVRMPGVAVADVDNDGDLDLLLCGQGKNGTARILLNDGDGQFAPGETLAENVACPTFGDLDNDGDVDLWLGRSGADQVWLNDGKGHFTLSPSEGIAGPEALTRLARLADIDSDGDLDLLAFRCAAGQIPAADGNETPAPSSVFFSNTDGSYVDRAAELGLQFTDTSVAAVAYDDFDNDFDLDLIVFPHQGPAVAWVNFRVGQHRLVPGESIGLGLQTVVSATTGDPDKDGDRDLLIATPAGLRLFLNNGLFNFTELATFATGCGRIGGTGGQFVDMDNDGDLDLVVPDAKRADGSRGPALLLNTWPDFAFVDATQTDPGNLLGALRTEGDASCVVADFTGDGRCDLLLAPLNQPALLLKNLTPGGHWIALDLAGKRPQDRTARSNSSAIGARVEVRTGALFQQYVVGGSAGPVASLPLRIHVGLGQQATVDWLRIMWPDAILQGEVEVAGDRVVAIEEQSRKPSSCPYLFAWDGQRFAFVADFGGVGGLGYYLGNNRYAVPDPTEYLPIPTLEPRDGQYVLQSLTPLEEITYFDQVKLMAIDHPAGTQVHPHEMAAVNVPPPEFRLFCVRQPMRPVQAVDHRGQDVTDLLQAIDRRYAGATDPDPRFIGLAADHFVDADFGDQLANLSSFAHVVLFLHGWVEYGYSSTNYAASQAGQRAKAPTIAVFRDGAWVTLADEVGYPAGVNHIMTVDLTGKLLTTDRRLRVSSNMELYWDEMFLAPHDADAEVRIQEMAPRVADLHFRGYPREYSPDGHHPNLCDYNNLDRNVGWKRMAGDYTRFGDVRPLLDKSDDCFVIMGHGEEITLQFSVADFGPVPAGFVRSFVLKTDSYCKDMDLYTAFPTTVEPLPFHGMSGYPYEDSEQYPDTETTRHYRSLYNTRRISGR